VLDAHALATQDGSFYLVGLIGGKDVGKSALVNALAGRDITATSAYGPGTEGVIAYAHVSQEKALREAKRNGASDESVGAVQQPALPPPPIELASRQNIAERKSDQACDSESCQRLFLHVLCGLPGNPLAFFGYLFSHVFRAGPYLISCFPRCLAKLT